MTFSELIKYQFKHGSWLIRIIFVNAIIFLVINLLYLIDNGMTNYQGPLSKLANNLFSMPLSWKHLVWKPWTIVTHMFAHHGLFHFLFNMLWLYFGGQIFLQFLGNKRLLYIYVLGGLFAALAQLLADTFIPFYKYVPGEGMLGASGAVYAVFIAIAYYRPMHSVNIFGLFPLRIVYIALFMVVGDFLRLMDVTNVAHMAHLGGAIFGAVAVANLDKLDRFIAWFERRAKFFKGGLPAMRSKLFMRKQAPPKVKHYHKADEKFYESKKEIQENIDRILDKIKVKGYDGLTKAEKDYLFEQKDKI